MAQHNAAGELPARTLETVPAKARLAIILLLVLGSATLLTALLTDAARAWRAYLFNWLYWTSIAQGAVILAAAVTMTRGIWSQPVRRIALSFVAFLPVSFLLLLPLLFAAGQVFPWVHQELGGKEAWLNVPFLAARNLAGLATLFGLSLAFAYWALRPDAGLLLAQASPRHSGPECRGLYARLTRGWQGQEVEEARAHRNLSRLSPVLALTYAIVFSIVAFDFVMSLEPEWFSTLIGPYFFMAAFLGGIAATALLTVVYRRGLGLGSAIQPPQLHDLGKLTFAFCVFWAYLFWSQYLVIWYGLLPREQSFVIHRLSAPFTPLAVLVFFCLFVIPFFGLLGATPKRTPGILAAFAGVVLFGLWIERYTLIYPSHYPRAAELYLGWQEVGIAFAFAGLLLASLMFFATRFPLFQLWQPLSELELLRAPGELPSEPE